MKIGRNGLRLLLLLSSPVAAGAAVADNVTFQIRAYTSNAVEVNFHAAHSRRSWPGGGQVYIIQDDHVARYRLDCRRGEKICYGASIFGHPDKAWGVGLAGTSGCKGCCFVCQGDESTPIISLHER